MNEPAFPSPYSGGGLTKEEFVGAVILANMMALRRPLFSIEHLADEARRAAAAYCKKPENGEASNK